MTKIDDYLLAAYLNGTAQEAEREKVEQWIQQEPQNQQQFEHFKSIWIEAGKLRNHQPIDTDKSWQRFQKLRNQQTKNPKLIPWRSWIARAAAVLLICTLSYVAWEGWQNTKDQELITSMEQMSNVLLPDGTRVWLNKNSQLSYPREFEKDERRVRLTGEAYFEVVPDTERPFLISGGDTEVRVLGTSFNINTTKDQTEIVVNSGKVAFYGQGSPEEQVTLQDGDKGTFHSLDHRVTKAKNQDPNYLSWKTGLLLFGNMTLEKTVETLERHYARKVALEHPAMADCRINTRFDRQTLPEVLEEISLLLGGSFDQTPDGYLLKGAGCR